MGAPDMGANGSGADLEERIARVRARIGRRSLAQPSPQDCTTSGRTA